MIYIVLGMHKSGTTLMAEILHKSGINMVDEVNYDSNLTYGHLKGKMERQSMVTLNHQFLNSKNVSSLDINIAPDELELAGALFEKEIKDVIEHCQATNQTWGFKDPRTCLTYPIWQRYLPEHKIIFIYRRPEKVIEHYSKYFTFPKKYLKLYRALVTYNAYNLRLLNIIKGTKIPCIIISYEQLIDDKRALDKLSDFVGTPLFDARKKTDHKTNKQGAQVFWILNFLTRNKAGDIYNQLEKLKLSGEMI